MALGREEAYEACLASLKQTDTDRYLSCLLIPETQRGPIAALYAFNAEIARIRDVVRDALPGEVRLQWWRDMVEGTAHGDAMNNPVAAGLIYAVEDHALPRPVLSAMTEARIFDLYNDPMPSVTAFEGYAGETASALIQLASLVLDAAAASHMSEVAGHAGVAQAAAGAILLLPIHSHRGQVYVPADILAATGLDTETFLAGQDSQRIAAAVEAFAGFGRDHVNKAREAAGEKLPASLVGAYTPVALAGPVLVKAEKMGAEVLTQPIQPSQWRRQWRMWRSSRSGRF